MGGCQTAAHRQLAEASEVAPAPPRSPLSEPRTDRLARACRAAQLTCGAKRGLQGAADYMQELEHGMTPPHSTNQTGPFYTPFHTGRSLVPPGGAGGHRVLAWWGWGWRVECPLPILRARPGHAAPVPHPRGSPWHRGGEAQARMRLLQTMGC